MEVLPAASGSWFELDGPKSARVQPAGALGVHGSPSKWWNIGEINRCFTN